MKKKKKKNDYYDDFDEIVAELSCNIIIRFILPQMKQLLDPVLNGLYNCFVAVHTSNLSANYLTVISYHCICADRNHLDPSTMNNFRNTQITFWSRFVKLISVVLCGPILLFLTLFSDLLIFLFCNS